MRYFVIITEARCGYQLMAQLLNSNPEICCLGEIYSSNPATRRKSIFGYNIPTIDEWFSGVRYFETIKPLVGRRVLGFKLSYMCARRDEWKDIREKVIDDRWPVIHLFRENYLDRIISDKLAAYEENWNHKEYQSQISIHPEELEYLYNRGLVWRTDADRDFANNPMLKLSYEELVYDREATCNRIQRFVGASPMQLTAELKKQRVGGQRQYVKNYKQLYDACVNHPLFGRWFDGISYL